MLGLDALQDLFKEMSEYSDYSRVALTFATTSGFLFLGYVTLSSVYHVVQAIRLYFFAQLCCKTNYAKKYGKWALVTGATDGIGLEMAKELAARGQSIIIVGRNEQKLANAKEQVEREGADIEVMTVQIDLSDSSRENYARAKQLIDPDNRDIGVLINNAGTTPSEMRSFHTDEESQFLDVVNVNILAVLHFTRMILPGMIDRERGLVVNISSQISFFERSPFFNVYGPTKKFVDRFTSNMICEYDGFPIDFININPGAIQTKLFRGVNDHERLSKPNFLVPAAEDFARTAVNAMSTRMTQYSGCLGHALSRPLVYFVQSIKLDRMMSNITFRRSSSKYHPSVFTSKKNLKNSDQTGGEAQAQVPSN